MSGTNCQIIETDLDRDLRFSPEIVEICGDTVRVFRNGVEISHYNDVRNFSIECNVSVCRLIAHLSNGDRVNVVFSQREKKMILESSFTAITTLIRQCRSLEERSK